jgi:hypothetical protein
VLQSPPREKTAVRAIPNGHGLKIIGIPTTIASDAHLPIFSKGKPEAEGRAEMQKEKARIAYETLERYIRENRYHRLSAEHVAGLAALAGFMKICAMPERRIEAPQPITLDAALMQIKGVIKNRKDAKTMVYSIDDSESQHDYMLSKGLLVVAKALSFYLEPDEGKIRVVLTRSSEGSETQLSIRGSKTIALSEKDNSEANYAIRAGLGMIGANLDSNGSYYLIRIPIGAPSA